MSICRGIAGNRGRNPVGIFIHNDAGSSAANASHYRNWLQTHDLGNGFAHYYVASDGILQAEDDNNMAWHCGQTDGNNNYLSIEVCQSTGDLNQFKKNEEEALKLAAQKCKQYGITPNASTIRLHQEVYATACPHRSVEIHGGKDATKAYFINKIKEYMNDTKKPEEKKGETTMQCLYEIEGEKCVYYFDGTHSRPLGHMDEMEILKRIYRDNNGHEMPYYKFGKKDPWHNRLKAAMTRKQDW